MARAKKVLNIAAFDFETDPFKYERVPQPFVWGFKTADDYVSCWSESPEYCIKSFFDHLDTLKQPHIIYAHNGGKFDFMYFIEKFQGELRIINGRIVEAKYGIHTFRDSYAILPVPLSNGGEKLDIDYRKMERDTRHLYKNEIMDYLFADCVALYNLVSEFIAEFGPKLTIGSAAMAELKKFHKFDTLPAYRDSLLRDYYFGGRCQAFETGIIDKNIKIFDVNSMYPYVMKNFKHPIGDFYIGSKITEETGFVKFIGYNKGACPVRKKGVGLDFNVEYGEFKISIHEYNAAIDTGTIIVEKIIETINFIKWGSFEEFVDHFFSKRNQARDLSDTIRVLFYKLILNSAYGKFATDCANFKDWEILDIGVIPDWYLELEKINSELPLSERVKIEVKHYETKTLWGRPSEKQTYLNVATAASITGAARAVLLRGLVAADNPVYCDTDAIACVDLPGVKIHKSDLGAWDLEAEGDMMAIAGKKLYALFSNGNCVKMAAKGISVVPLDVHQFVKGETTKESLKAAKQYAKNLGAEKIRRAAMGDLIHSYSSAPNFKIDGRVLFIHRRAGGR